jgi:hypothetical protein
MLFTAAKPATRLDVFVLPLDPSKRLRASGSES